jgi:D-alanyl-D-alanine-carboxypeptidase/D-alanyl-D-alanine-endopeptidase
MLLLISAISLGSGSLAQQPLSPHGNVRGNYVGMLGPLRVNLHITAAADGKLSATLDSPDQGANGIPCAEVKIEGQALTFSVPAVGGTWMGTVEDDGSKLSGTWNQGIPTPLTFTRDTFVAASKPSPVDGFWLGTLQPPSPPLKVQLTVKSDESGQQFCTLDSLDQGTFGLEGTNVVLSGRDFSFEIPVVIGHWRGRLYADGNVLDGTWTQGLAAPLRFDRQGARQTPSAPK